MLLAFTSCNDWFDKDSEDGTITNKKNFENAEAFYQALTGVYTQLRDQDAYGGTLNISILEFMGQNFKPQNSLTKAAAEFDYKTLEKEKVISKLWLKMYSAIAQINQVIEEIEKTDILFKNKNQKEIITGELYALRGMIHFDLLRLFHPNYKEEPNFVGIPYMTKFGITVSKPQSSSEIINLIIDDLNHATNLLKDIDPILNGQSLTSASVGEIDSKLRTFQMNYYAVTATLARVYLYKGDHENAFVNADICYNHIRDIDQKNQVFYFFNPSNIGSDYSFSREHIFGLASPPEGLTTLSERLFEEQLVKVSNNFSNVYPFSSDTRFRTWFKKQDDDSYIMSQKFSREALLSGYINSSNNAGIDLPVRIPIIKLGEICLIAAEALNEQNETEKAADWLIIMQNSKDITVVKDQQAAGVLTQNSLREEIRNEYYREFYGEGQLFYFYKRMNDLTIMSYDKNPIPMNTVKYTMPIPSNGL